MRVQKHTIREEDVGKRRIKRPPCPHCGHISPPMDLGNAMGNVTPQDVGKRVYDIDGVTCVENDAQFKKRLEREAYTCP